MTPYTQAKKLAREGLAVEIIAAFTAAQMSYTDRLEAIRIVIREVDNKDAN